MGYKEKMLVIIIIIWIFALLITGSLAIIYKVRHKNYLFLNKEYTQSLKNIEPDFTLKTYDVKYEMPKDEECYYFSSNIPLYVYPIIKKQKKKSINDANPKFEFYRSLKNNFSLLYINHKKSCLVTSIFVTNNRVLFETPNEFIQFPITKIKNIYGATYNIDKTWYNGIEIVLEKVRYRINISDIELLMTFKKIIEGGNN